MTDVSQGKFPILNILLLKPKCEVPRDNLPWEMVFTMVCVTAPYNIYFIARENEETSFSLVYSHCCHWSNFRFVRIHWVVAAKETWERGYLSAFLNVCVGK